MYATSKATYPEIANYSQSAPIIRGMGCAGASGCGCGCAGLGLFDSGLDLSQWGFAEWGIAAFGLYAVISLISDTKRATGRARRSLRKRSARAAKRAKLKAELAEA